MKSKKLLEDLKSINCLLKISVLFHIAFSFFINAYCLEFPDKKGVIVAQENDYIIRLIDSEQSSIKTAEAVFTVYAKPEKCFDIISDIPRYPEFMPNITKTSFVKKTDCCLIYDFVFKAAFMDMAYTVSVNNERTGDQYKSGWNYVKGDLKETKGSWIIEPVKDSGEVSIIRYNVYLDPGSFMPGWLQNRLTAGSIPDMICAIKKRAEKK
jgi:ribosome-associated toxin RatA of RatAB toxin-antitoxin module